MPELKTLKTIIGCANRIGVEGSICKNCGKNHTITEECLKQSAIEWVKELSKEIDKIKYSPEHYMQLQKYLNGNNENLPKELIECSSQISWIKYRYNLTEEDLKEDSK